MNIKSAAFIFLKLPLNDESDYFPWESPLAPRLTLKLLLAWSYDLIYCYRYY